MKRSNDTRCTVEHVHIRKHTLEARHTLYQYNTQMVSVCVHLARQCPHDMDTRWRMEAAHGIERTEASISHCESLLHQISKPDNIVWIVKGRLHVHSNVGEEAPETPVKITQVKLRGPSTPSLARSTSWNTTSTHARSQTENQAGVVHIHINRKCV